MTTIYVKEAAKEDSSIIADMIARLKMLNEELDPHFKTIRDLETAVREYVNKMIEDENSKILLALDADTSEAVGVLILRREDRVFYEPRIKAVITDFYVKPKYRRKRIGTLLLEKALEEAKEMGAGILTVVYPAGNTIADEFYKKAGFKELQIEKYKPLF